MKRLRRRIAYWLLGWPAPKPIRRPPIGEVDPDAWLPEDVRRDMEEMQRRQEDAIRRLHAETWDEE